MTQAAPEPTTGPTDQSEHNKKPEKSASTLLVELAQERYTLGVTPDGKPYGVPNLGDDLHIARMLRGGKDSLRAELAREYYAKFKKAPAQQALADALLVLEGMAQEAEPEEAHLRLADIGGMTLLDLGDDAAKVVALTSTSWYVLHDYEESPVRFARTGLTAPFPAPARGGDIAELWEHVNAVPEDRPHVLAWLVHNLVAPNTPQPVLALLAEFGSAKTTTTKRLVALTDPSVAELRKPPRDTEQWVTAATGSRVIALDNLTRISDELSDSICRAVTGEADVRRRLFTDDGLQVFRFKRAVILNGMDLGALRGDLVDRTVTVSLNVITEKDRRGDEETEAKWKSAYPRLFGALLDIAQRVKAVRPDVRLASMPRMADYARTLAAVDAVLGTEGYERYMDQLRTMLRDSLTGNPFISRLAESITFPYTGTAAELLDQVRPLDPNWRSPKGWPASPRAVTGLLKSHSATLRRLGWDITEIRDSHHNCSVWTLLPPRESD